MLANMKDSIPKTSNSDPEDENACIGSSSSDVKSKGKSVIVRSIAKRKDKNLWSDAVEKKEQKPLAHNSETALSSHTMNTVLPANSGSSSSSRIPIIAKGNEVKDAQGSSKYLSPTELDEKK